MPKTIRYSRRIREGRAVVVLEEETLDILRLEIEFDEPIPYTENRGVDLRVTVLHGPPDRVPDVVINAIPEDD